MKLITLSQPEYTGHSQVSASNQCEVYNFESYQDSVHNPSDAGTKLGKLLDDWGQDLETRDAISEARKWVSSTYYEDQDSIRRLRLAKGLSQSDLAKLLGTSQPHIARIEKGTENIQLSTCRRLCSALDIDLNTLGAVIPQSSKAGG